MIEIVFTVLCWTMLLPSGQINCYCQEQPPQQVEVVNEQQVTEIGPHVRS